MHEGRFFCVHASDSLAYFFRGRFEEGKISLEEGFFEGFSVLVEELEGEGGVEHKLDMIVEVEEWEWKFEFKGQEGEGDVFSGSVDGENVGGVLIFVPADEGHSVWGHKK